MIKATGNEYVQMDFDPADLTPRVRRGVRKAMVQSVKHVQAAARSAAPRGERDVSGQRHLQDAIRSGVKTIRRTNLKGPFGYITAPVKHAQVVEYGGRVGRGPDPYAGRHPGRKNIKRKATPYLRPAFQQEKERFAAAVAAVFRAEVDRRNVAAANAAVTLEDRDQ